MAYGDTREQAASRTMAMAFRTIADQPVHAWPLLTCPPRQRLTPEEKSWKRGARDLDAAIADLSRNDLSLLTKIARRLKS